ncbi:MAG: hypothetical protein HYX52_01135 [Chloroflexi bacterium]|nr:hypothetical protein [Chloroflexota bacterium]
MSQAIAFEEAVAPPAQNMEHAILPAVAFTTRTRLSTRVLVPHRPGTLQVARRAARAAGLAVSVEIRGDLARIQFERPPYS